jgi:RND family efflux transporter MFP subunit
MKRALLALLLLAPAARAETLTVQATDIVDQKAVFATVESPNVVPARARIGGTVIALSVRDGDAVQVGQTIATIVDDKIALQIRSLDAQIVGLQAQVAQAQTDLARAETLYRQGSGPKVTMDQARTALDVAQSSLKARIAEREVTQQSMAEGAVHAPVAGRILQVPVTQGSVALPGDSIAMIAEQGFKLRLRIPERYAAGLREGDTIRADAGQLGVDKPLTGRITLVYPQIEEGRVVADAAVPGLGDYFVGERLRVWIAAGHREGIILPPRFIITRFGLDNVRLQRGSVVEEVPVQRGTVTAEGIEILSGVMPGDVLVAP